MSTRSAAVAENKWRKAYKSFGEANFVEKVLCSVCEAFNAFVDYVEQIDYFVPYVQRRTEGTQRLFPLFRR